MIQMGTGRDGAAWSAMQSSAARRHLSVPQGETERAVQAEEQVVGGGGYGRCGGYPRGGSGVAGGEVRWFRPASAASSGFTEDSLFHLATVTIME